MTAYRVRKIEELLTAALQPSELKVKDQSQLHAGHAGARDGRGHFEVVVCSRSFSGKSRLQRHQMVYHALGEFMESDIHALRIKARAPDDD